MIDQGALMEAHDCHYGTPLHVACARQHYDCAKVLLNAGECMFTNVYWPETWIGFFCISEFIVRS